MIYTVTLNPAIDHTMHFPGLVLGGLNRATTSRKDLGGKGVNVSRALRQFGVETVVMGFAAGMFGRALLGGLRLMGFDCDFVEIGGETRSNVTVIDQATGATTKLNEPGPTVTRGDLRAFQERLLARLSEGDVCVFSGSLPPGTPSDAYARLISAAHDRGAMAVLDTSGDPLVSGCAARPDWVKPNADEAAQLVGMPFGTPDEILRGSRAILDLGPQRVLLSLGRRGAVLADDHAGWFAEPPTISEESAVGAGDALMAGALWAWGEQMPPEEIVGWAVASGTAAAMERGTGMPTLCRIKDTYDKVSVIRLQGGVA